MFFLISNLYTAYENVNHIIGFIKPNFLLPNYRCFSSFFTYVDGLGSGIILSSHSFCFIFPYFSIGCPLSIFHLAPLHLSSCPSIFHLAPLHHSSSPDLLISHLTQSIDLSCSFPFSCILYVFSPFSSTLFTSMSASSILGGGGDIFNLVQPPSDKLHQSRTSHIII